MYAVEMGGYQFNRRTFFMLTGMAAVPSGAWGKFIKEGVPIPTAKIEVPTPTPNGDYLDFNFIPGTGRIRYPGNTTSEGTLLVNFPAGSLIEEPSTWMRRLSLPAFMLDSGRTYSTFGYEMQADRLMILLKLYELDESKPRGYTIPNMILMGGRVEDLNIQHTLTVSLKDNKTIERIWDNQSIRLV